MKNVKYLLVAAWALVSAASMASVGFQPGAPVSEDAPMRVSTGVGTSFVKTKAGFGVDNIGVGLGFAHNVGYDFEYGIGIGAAYAKPMSARLFKKDLEKSDGFGTNVEAMFRFMPEIAENFRLGGRLNIGWDAFFGGKDNAEYKKVSEGIAFGDLNFRVGPSMSWGMSDMCSLYFSPALALNNVRVISDKATDKDGLKKSSNLFGAEAQLGLMFAVSDNVGFVVETTPKITNFKDAGNSFREDLVAGVTFAM